VVLDASDVLALGFRWVSVANSIGKVPERKQPPGARR
jgi:hypothetical protein